MLTMFLTVLVQIRWCGGATGRSSILEQVVNEGCNYIQFDEPVWTENVSQSKWGAETLNYIIDQFPGIKFNLHICGGNAHRKRGFFGRYTDMIEAFKILKVDEIHLEHCSLHYDMLRTSNCLFYCYI